MLPLLQIYLAAVFVGLGHYGRGVQGEIILAASHRRLRQEVKLILLSSSPVLGTTVSIGSGVTDLG